MIRKQNKYHFKLIPKAMLAMTLAYCAILYM